MLKVYFTAATSYNGELQEYYRKIFEQLKTHDIEVTSGHQIIDKTLLAKDKKLSTKQIFEREKKFINEADCIIAEASRPSLSVGAEITYALSKEKHVLALVIEEYAGKLYPIIAGQDSEYFFLEYYNSDKLSYILNDFLRHVCNIVNKKGKLIVLEGTDGAGKATQAELLVKYLKNKRIPVKYIDFPRYYHSFHGKTVAKLLRGEFGNIDEVSPYLASLAYALDRAAAKREMHAFLKKGGFIIANRYVQSNIAYQGAKLKTPEEKNKFFKWITELEYRIHKLPKEDLVIYLEVPLEIGKKLILKKNKRLYLMGKTKDIYEKDQKYQKEVQKMYQDISKKFKNWIKIDCVENKKILPPQQIHRKIIKELCDHSICI